jgi:predicted ATP-grasp superfamily ATP-dependent carboligase
MKPLGEDSHHWLIANLAVATGIAPSVLLQESDRMLNTMLYAIRYQRGE